ncbi:hypothetical protein HAHE_37320 [Haloferula helveola]|uniref:PPM-type phosphatase domain-containing protein n=1 Tax=Haloferula helveola TaxID=490095 RepID=A0ABN6HBG2_9BACT|nr:hypothetical protein HAHE_37320 [Haloferula helveola]
MNPLKPGLRGKFIVALLVAALLPLVVGVVVLQTVGFKHMLAERGRAHGAEAHALAEDMDHMVVGEAGKLRTWISAGDAVQELAIEKSAEAEADPAEADKELVELEKAWPSLEPGDPELESVISNVAAERLVEFIETNPSTAELIVADTVGRLIAASRKTSDFDQSDEIWWKEGVRLKEGEFRADVLHFDESAGVHSIDLVFSLQGPDRQPVGVVKMVIEVSPLFATVGVGAEAEKIEVILPDGVVISRPLDRKEGSALVFDHDSMLTLLVGRCGWTTLKDTNGDLWMTGFAAIESSLEDKRHADPGGYVIFASRRSSVVAPVRAQLGWVALAAGFGVLVCGGLGYVLIDRQILRPMNLLGDAARAVADTARLHRADPLDGPPTDPEKALLNIESIRTGDEIEALAKDVGVMTSRVLRYQRELEAEVESKTSVIREDLEMAREFQTALLPSAYPESPAGSDFPLRLGFAHFYQPASTVGGDFFDLIELEDGRVGVLIADVMGHGSRSALVTAILRALVGNHGSALGNPGEFLGTLNEGLHEVIARSGQTLFVTAFLMVLDPAKSEMSWAVAGHPSPLKARRGNGRLPKPLWTSPQHQPPLGLVAGTEYVSHREELDAGDVFLLYTDGLIEAEDRSGEAFGPERLASAFDQALDGPLAAMPAQIVGTASGFRKVYQYEDDVCLVAVEARVNRSAPASHPEVLTGSASSGA